MNSILYERFAGHALFRAAFRGVLGALLFTVPGFLLNGMFYALVGYMLVNGVWRTVDFFRWKTARAPSEKRSGFFFRYLNLLVAVLMIAAAIPSVTFRALLIGTAPVYLGVLLVLEGIAYFVIALCAETFPKRVLLVVLSAASLLGGAAVAAFTFGFGTGGVSGLAKVSGSALLLACLFELTAWFEYRKSEGNRSELEDNK